MMKHTVAQQIRSYFDFITAKKAIVIICLVGIVIFFNSLFNGFVADDLPQIVHNPKIQSASQIPSFFEGGTYYESVDEPLKGIYYRPLMLTIFAVASTIFGLNSLTFHLLQIFLHILNAILVFYLFKYFFREKTALFLSLIFLVHPINSESVFYISDLQDVLFFSFGISSLLLLIYKKEKLYTSIFSPLLLLLSLLSKETGILFFFMLVTVILFLQKDRIFRIFLFGISLLTYFSMRIPAVGLINSSKAGPIAHIDLLGRLINIPSLIMFYLVRFFYPKDLVYSYNEVIRNVSFTNFYAPLIGALLFAVLGISLGIFVWIKVKGEKFAYLFFSIWLILGMGLHLQIIPLDMSASERWFYFPMVGVLGLVGILISGIYPKTGSNRKTIQVFALLVIFLLSMRTIVRSYDWQDNLTLNVHDVKIYRNDYLIMGNLGFELVRSGDLEGAESELKKSIELYPYAINNYANYCSVLGKISLEAGEMNPLSKSITCFERMAEIFESPEVYKRLIGLLLISNDFVNAEKYVNEALIKYPNSAYMWLNLAQIKEKMNDLEGAKHAIDQAYKLDPQNPQILKLYKSLYN